MKRDPEYLTGYLFGTERALARETRLVWPTLSFRRTIYAVSREEGSGHLRTQWEEYEFHSETSFLDEESLGEKGPFIYKLVCRRAGPQLLAMARDKRIIDYLWLNDLREAVGSRLSRIPIKVDDLVKLVARSPGKYVLSSVYARVPAYGEFLRAVSFFGDDIAEAPVFRENLSLWTCYSCGVRNVVGGSEIVRLGTEGNVNFLFSGHQSAKRVDEVLGFVSENDLFGE